MNDITTLREHLFKALDRIAAADTKETQELEAEKACTIVQLSEAILDTAKVESNLIQLMKQSGSGFILITDEKKTPVREIEKQYNGHRINGSDNSELQYFKDEPLGIAQ